MTRRPTGSARTCAVTPSWVSVPSTGCHSERSIETNTGCPTGTTVAAGGLRVGTGEGSRVIIWRYRTSRTLRSAVAGTNLSS